MEEATVSDGTLKKGGFETCREHVLLHVVRLELTQAIRLLRGWLRSHPDDVEALVLLGRIRFRQGDMNGAFADATRSIEQQPRCAAAFRLRAAICYETGIEGGALQDCDRCLDIDPDDVPALELRSLLRARNGDMVGMEADCATILRLRPKCPNDPPCDEAISLEPWGLAEVTLRVTPGPEPTTRHLDGLLHRGTCWMLLGDYWRARKDYLDAGFAARLQGMKWAGLGLLAERDRELSRLMRREAGERN